jgi:hypothetical protein
MLRISGFSRSNRITSFRLPNYFFGLREVTELSVKFGHELKAIPFLAEVSGFGVPSRCISCVGFNQHDGAACETQRACCGGETGWSGG